MKRKIPLARALREKNRVAGRLREIRGLISKENSKDKRQVRKIDVRGLLQEEEMLHRRLVEIKSTIALANQGIVKKIIELDEAKSEVAWWTGIDTTDGVNESGTGYGVTREKEYEAIVNQSEILEKSAVMKRRIESLQDEIDEFNAMTRIEIEFDD